MEQEDKPPSAAFLMGDKVAVGWRYGTRWIVIGVFRPKHGFYTYDIQVDRRSKGAFQG